IHRVKLITQNVEATAGEMISTSEEMTNRNTEIATSIAQISRGAQEQVSKVDESSRLIENMLTSSESIGQQSDVITNAAEIVNKRSRNGLNMVNTLLESMKEISDLSRKSEVAMKGLEERSKEI